MIKNWTLMKLVLLASFFAPITPLIIVATVLSMFDWITKIYCILRTQGRKEIKSSKMKDKFYDIILHTCFIGVLFIIDPLFIKSAGLELFNHVFSVFLDESTSQIIANWLAKVSLASVGTMMVLARETVSIDENWEQAFGYSVIGYIKEKIQPLLIWKKFSSKG